LKKFFGLYITHSKYIFKFWVTQVTMSAFGLFIGFPSIATEKNWLIVISSIFAIAFLVFLLYDMMFMYGLSESVRVYKDGRTPDKLKGLKIAMLSYAPTILIITLYIISILFNLQIVFIITQSIMHFVIHGTYFLFFYILADSIPLTLIAIITLIPGIAACTLGYYLGEKDLPIRKLLGIPVKPPKPPKNK